MTPPKHKFNTLFDVAFTLDHDYEDPADIPAALLIEALERRVADLRREPSEAAGAFGISDTYEHEDKELFGTS